MTPLQDLISSDERQATASGGVMLTASSELPADLLRSQYLLEKRLYRTLAELRLPAEISDEMGFEGFCGACGNTTRFSLRLVNEDSMNWRETLRCSQCQLINRWRSAAEICLPLIDTADPEHSVYLTEKLTPLFHWFEQQVPNLIGSEYCSADTLHGQTCQTVDGVFRHEDVTELSFADDAHSHILTFDVLEHVPNYKGAISEFFRCLRPGGILVISAPFDIKSEQTLVRATIDEHGNIHHLTTPEYHGDPVNAEGILSFYTFGWDLLNDLRRGGFDEVGLQLVWNPERGYLGLGQCFISARKGRKV